MLRRVTKMAHGMSTHVGRGSGHGVHSECAGMGVGKQGLGCAAGVSWGRAEGADWGAAPTLPGALNRAQPSTAMVPSSCCTLSSPPNSSREYTCRQGRGETEACTSLKQCSTKTASSSIQEGVPRGHEGHAQQQGADLGPRGGTVEGGPAT